MFAKFSILALAVVALASPITERATQPNASEVYITSIVYGGSGCPQGSVGSYISDNRQTFTLIFDNYVASIGTGVAVTENRKNCQLNIALHYPSGFQYSVDSTIFRGYVDLSSGVSALQKATYYFSGDTAQVSTSASFSGPVSKDYTVTSNLDLASVVWAPCGASTALNINSQVRLTGSGSGEITDDSIDGKITFVVGIQWQTC